MDRTRITAVRGREILDSRGLPTVEADVVLSDGTLGRASVPSGRSIGTHEAVELRDGDPRRYRGLGVQKAVDNINRYLAPAVGALDALDQPGIDSRLIEVDGSSRKERLGANAILAVSLANCRAAAAASRIPLYRHIAHLAGVSQVTLPLPMVNMISGGLHSGGQIDIQDVLAIPTRARSFKEALEHVSAIHYEVGERVRREGHPALVADEGGWAPQLAANDEAIAWVAEAIRTSAADARVAVDLAATQFFTNGQYEWRTERRTLAAREMIEVISGWCQRWQVVSVEDPLAEDDWAGWAELTQRLGSRLQIIGDDIFATNLARLSRAAKERIANAILVKVNQVGTLWETLQVIRTARDAGYRIVVSARSGETEDSFLADLAVGTAADQIKVGSLTRSSRLAKWNQLLRIEEEVGPGAYVGLAGLPGGD